MSAGLAEVSQAPKEANEEAVKASVGAVGKVSGAKWGHGCEVVRSREDMDYPHEDTHGNEGGHRHRLMGEMLSLQD